MPHIRQENLDQLLADNDLLNEQLAHWQSMAPYLGLAEDIKKRIVGELESGKEASASEIGDLAYKAALASERQQAENDLTARYEQEHRKALYEHVLSTVEQEDGESIKASVFARLDTDPQLAVELRKSARKELTARANSLRKATLTEEQKEVIDQETERQMALDRLDVEFALEGKLDISSEVIGKLLRPGDRLIIKFAKQEIGQTSITFTWQEDIHGKTGWVFSTTQTTRDTSYYTTSKLNLEAYNIPTDRFVRLGSQLPDLEAATKEVCQDKLICQKPLVIRWSEKGKGSTHTLKEQTITKGGYTDSTALTAIHSTDFQTRDIEFAN